MPGRAMGELQWPVYWVFGTELPRVVVNEALAETGRVESDYGYADSIRVFVELHNPMPRSIPTSVYRPDSWPVPLRVGEGESAYVPYRVVIGVKSAVPLRASGAAILPGA